MRANYGVFCPLVNLTTINHRRMLRLSASGQLETTTVHSYTAAPDHHSSLVYIVYIYSGSAIGVEHWVGHAVANILETMYGSMTLATVTNNHNTAPNF